MTEETVDALMALIRRARTVIATAKALNATADELALAIADVIEDEVAALTGAES